MCLGYTKVQMLWMQDLSVWINYNILAFHGAVLLLRQLDKFDKG